MTPRRVMTVVGTRPEAIKLAPLILALSDRPGWEPVVVATAQHREMLDQVFDTFGIRADHDLDLQRPRQTLSEITTRAVAGLDPILAGRRPDLLVVQGDTTTSFAAALVAFYHRVPVGHVEAGLRTGDPLSPYPEEVNRRLTTQLTALHLAPTPVSVANLEREGVDPATILCTGNTVIDALQAAVDLAPDYGDAALDALDATPGRVVLVTVHRRESWGAPNAAGGRALARTAASHPDVTIVVPLHPNPAVRDVILPALGHAPNVVVVDPLPYGGFARLIDRSDLVVTDSGGIQEEAPSRGKPVLVLRDTTERPEAVAAGTVELIGTDEEHVTARIEALLGDTALYERMARAVNPYGDGRATERILAGFRWWFGDGPRPAPFAPPPPR
jgi:UDP-N-acetylglucosamine 2-epimerase (non-hydrolysing)